MILNIYLSKSWCLHQLYVKDAILYVSLDEIINMHQPPGLCDPRHPKHACLLKKSIYGLKQAPHAWYQRFTTMLPNLHHKHHNISDHFYRHGIDIAFIILYVNEIIIVASSNALSESIFMNLALNFS